MQGLTRLQNSRRCAETANKEAGVSSTPHRHIVLCCGCRMYMCLQHDIGTLDATVSKYVYINAPDRHLVLDTRPEHVMQASPCAAVVA